MLLMAVTYLVDFYFPTDILAPGHPPVTATGYVHSVDALVGWILFPVSAGLISSRFNCDGYWGTKRILLNALNWSAIVLLVLLLVALVSKASFGALIEKSFILIRNLWVLTLANYVLNASPVAVPDL